MDSTVKSRPNHYEVLGLKIGASSDEITRAFMREICVDRPRPFGGVALLSIAYETLRNPAKRRAYDESIGIAKPAPKIEPRTASFIAASLRSPADVRPMIARVPSPSSTFVPKPQPQERRADTAAPHKGPVAQSQPAPELPPSLRQPVERVQYPRLDDAEQGGIEWKRPAGVAAALVLAVGVAGAWAGREAGNGTDEPAPAVSMRLPAPKPAPTISESSPTPTPLIGPAQHERSARTVIAAVPSGAAHPPAAPDGLKQVEATLADNAAEPNSTAEAAAEPAPADEQLTQPVQASMPLPNSVIARTIGRIGYACGDVASIEGAGGGTFKITCTSGDSYRASPRRGRYHFKRLSAG